MSTNYFSFLAQAMDPKSHAESTLQSYSVFETKQEAYRRITRVLSSKTMDNVRLGSTLQSIIIDVIRTLTDLDLFKNSFQVRSIRAIYIVGIITGRLEIAKKVLNCYGSNDIMGDYLLGAMLCRAIGQKLPYEYMSLTNTYINVANEMESNAIELLNTCFIKNSSLTEQLLIRQLPHWGRHSCIELAIKSQSRNFIAHQSVQRLMKVIWRGSHKPSQTLEWKHYLSLVCPLSAPYLLDTKENSFNYIQKLLQFFHTPRN